ncbi:MAG: DNA repair protein RadC [Lachnospiraceae bacterium]|nr:DNA repair protein RadC [Lachnospiraceae bacterium]
MNHTTKELPVSERPYEKCMEQGPERLSDAELLAVLLRTGTPGNNVVRLATAVLQKGGGNLLALYQLSMDELMQIPGIGQVKAIQLKCMAELSKRIARTGRRDAVVLSDARSIAAYYMEQLRHEQQENLILCMFDAKCRLIRERVLTIGTVNASLISPREIFIQALEQHAVHVILVHNHPSGNPTPSKQDVSVTEQVRACGMMIGIELLDHIIIGDKRYFSFKEQEMI